MTSFTKKSNVFYWDNQVIQIPKNYFQIQTKFEKEHEIAEYSRRLKKTLYTMRPNKWSVHYLSPDSDYSKTYEIPEKIYDEINIWLKEEAGVK